MTVVSLACRTCSKGWTVEGVEPLQRAVCSTCGAVAHVTGRYRSVALSVAPRAAVTA